MRRSDQDGPRARVRSISPTRPTAPPEGGTTTMAGNPSFSTASASHNAKNHPNRPSRNRDRNKHQSDSSPPRRGRQQVAIRVKKPRSSSNSSGQSNSARRSKTPTGRRARRRIRNGGILQWTLWSVGLVFRAVSVLGAFLFCLRYAHLATGINLEMKQLVRTDWNMLGLQTLAGYPTIEEPKTVTNIVPEETQTEQQDNGTKHALQRKQPLNVTLPAWVICADGRNVSSCHQCSTSNQISLCAAPQYCQWCPHGALWDTTMPPDYPNLNQSVLVYDSDGSATRVYHAHQPLGMQCVSTQQTCRSKSSSVWQNDVKLLQSQWMADSARKAAPFVQAKPCQSRGYRFCPYGSLHDYHQLQSASHSNFTLLNNPQRPIQCMPRRLHCQPPDTLLVQPTDKLYRGPSSWSSAIVLPQFKFIFIPIAGVAQEAWKAVLQQYPAATDMANYSRPQATDMWLSPTWTKAIMVRDPLERLVGVYRDLLRSHKKLPLLRKACCPKRSSHALCAAKKKRWTFASFVTLLVDRQGCGAFDKAISKRLPWGLQSEWMEAKYWPYVTSVLQYSQAADDLPRLLQQVGAWPSNVPQDGSDPLALFQRMEQNATFQLADYYTLDDLRQKVEQLYAKDFQTQRLGLTNNVVDDATG